MLRCSLYRLSEILWKLECESTPRTHMYVCKFIYKHSMHPDSKHSLWIQHMVSSPLWSVLWPSQVNLIVYRFAPLWITLTSVSTPEGGGDFTLLLSNKQNLTNLPRNQAVNEDTKDSTSNAWHDYRQKSVLMIGVGLRMLVILNEILLDNTTCPLYHIAYGLLCVSFRLMSPSSDKSLRQSIDKLYV